MDTSSLLPQREITMNRILVNVILLSMMSMPVWAQPRHLSGPDDAHVFAGEDATLRCRMTDLTSSYAVAWQYFDGSGNGFIVGTCFGCSSSSGSCQTECTDTVGWAEVFTTTKISEDTFELRIRGVDVANGVTFGYHQCGYVNAEGIFYPFQSAIVYVYSPPRCNVALASSVDPDVTTQDITCIWEPRFYNVSGTAVQTQLLVHDAVLQPSLPLPNGIVQRSTMNGSSDLGQSNTTCRLTLPNGESNTTSCEYPGPREVSLYIEPLVTSVRVGETQVVSCNGVENDGVEYQWVFFRNGEEELLTSSISRLVGHVQFSSDSKGSFQVTPHSNTSRGQVFVECRVDTPSGVRNASAFGSIKILEAIYVDISTSGPKASTSQINLTHTPSTPSPTTSSPPRSISRIPSTALFSESHSPSKSLPVVSSSLKPTVTFPSSKPTGSFPSSKPTGPFPTSLTTKSSDDNGRSTSTIVPENDADDMEEEGGTSIVPFVIMPIVFIAVVFVGLAIAYWKRKRTRSFEQMPSMSYTMPDNSSESITNNVGDKVTMVTEVEMHNEDDENQDNHDNTDL